MSTILRPGACVEMAHGGGGLATTRLIREIFARHFANPLLDQGHDAARLDPLPPGRLVMSTDAHVVSPLEFPGGDIGSLAVHGTVNDVAMAGAWPVALAAAFIIEEGFPLADLDRIAASMGAAARAAGCRSPRAIPKWSNAAMATGCSSPPRASASCPKG
jgi:hydrogenase expression/formation protein HypE